MQTRKFKTSDRAVGRWPGILQQLGVDPSYLRNKHGPCPACGGKDRYRFDDKEGHGTWFCSHCGSGDGFALLYRIYNWNFGEAAEQVDRVVGTVPRGAINQERTEASKLEALRNTWRASQPVSRGDPVWTYLNKRTGIEIVPTEIHFHPALRYFDEDGTMLGTFPAMLALMRYPDGTGASLHRTYLNLNGGKANVPEPKKTMPGRRLNTAAVRLSPIDQHIGIAEGIETALAASRRFGVPIWAATNATLLADWVPPEGVKRVLIAGDNDATYTGQAAAYALAQRLARDGCEVEIRIPEVEGKDWADERI